jgi:hypothetical protein
VLSENNKFWDKTDFSKNSGFDHAWSKITPKRGMTLNGKTLSKMTPKEEWHITCIHKNDNSTEWQRAKW